MSKSFIFTFKLLWNGSVLGGHQVPKLRHLPEAGKNSYERKLNAFSLYQTSVYLEPSEIDYSCFAAQSIGPEVGLPVRIVPVRELTLVSVFRECGLQLLLLVVHLWGSLRNWGWMLLLLLLLCFNRTVGHHVGSTLTEMALFGLRGQLTLFGVMTWSSTVVAPRMRRAATTSYCKVCFCASTRCWLWFSNLTRQTESFPYRGEPLK